MNGRLYRLSKGAAQVECFQSARIDGAKSALVYIHGIEGGFNEASYIAELDDELRILDWSLIQVRLRSSWHCYGFYELHHDVADLELLVERLASSGFERIVLLGYSTGCQDIIAFLKTSEWSKKISAIVLHGPVSDRLANDYFNTDAADMIALARQMISDGKQDELMPRKALWGHPVTSKRYISFATKDGQDEMFAPDLTQDELDSRLGHVKVPFLVALCGSDQFVPPHPDHKATAERLKTALLSGNKDEEGNAASASRAVVIDGADHAMSGAEQQRAFLAHLIAFLKRIQTA